MMMMMMMMMIATTVSLKSEQQTAQISRLSFKIQQKLNK